MPIQGCICYKIIEYLNWNLVTDEPNFRITVNGLINVVVIVGFSRKLVGTVTNIADVVCTYWVGLQNRDIFTLPHFLDLILTNKLKFELAYSGYIL